MGIGERLKQERELKNMSLEEVQKMTKIQARYLDAIEQERFNVMPGSFYVRAFIKEYANVLGLNAEELMEEYKDDLPFEKEENIALSRVKSSKKNKPTVNTPVIFSFLPSVIVVLLIIGIVVLVWLFRQGYFGNDNDGDPTPVDDNDTTAGESVQQRPPSQQENPAEEEEDEEEDSDEEEVEEKELEEPKTEITLDNYENNESNYTVTTSEDELSIALSTEAQNWIAMEDQNGERLYYETLTTEKSPEEIDISEVDELYIRFGAPESISISINDEELTLSDEIGASQVQDAWITIQRQ
ncbi:helix-turn-helix domain-containing protein [Gracilibacillus massiliensis]|uniref:helix-turn-helix domain-containing protein n=1 Tax=Gracilibacillus massiliensis TaxID=1564956 RepID=UPI00071E6252|nr:RodZ domain-containing protein [Gracilibacillus massiliensis]